MTAPGPVAARRRALRKAAEADDMCQAVVHVLARLRAHLYGDSPIDGPTPDRLELLELELEGTT